MNGITSRLQVFLAKIAGKDVDVSTLTPPVAINEEEKLMLDIADRIDTIEESSGRLPDVTSEDNGDVLTVVEGEWAKADAPSGGEPFVIALSESNGEFTADKTFNEVLAAVNADTPIYIKTSYSTVDFGESLLCPMVQSIQTVEIEGATMTDIVVVCSHAQYIFDNNVFILTRFRLDYISAGGVYFSQISE